MHPLVVNAHPIAASYTQLASEGVKWLQTPEGDSLPDRSNNAAVMLQ